MKWEEARTKYLGRLQSLESLLSQLKRALVLEPSALDAEDSRKLHAIHEAANRQIKKLKDDEFHIAVVGLEKAGKSTFLNAWLRSDLLPNQTDRCTYTTTEIRSTTSADEQELVIEFFDGKTFDETRSKYEELAKSGPSRDAQNASEDLAEIERNLSQIRQRLDRPSERIPFREPDTIIDVLWDYVANPAVARAVKTVRIVTHQVLAKRGLVFHDVPGYDSPISMHKELARQELARADVIIFLTDLSSNPSINEGQLQMLDVADREDVTIKAHDKMFVFLNKVDKTQGKADFEDRYTKAIREWCERYKKCIPERVVPGSSGAYLMQHGVFVRDETRNLLESAQGRLAEANVPFGDGIEHLQSLVTRYIETERADILIRRSESLLNDGRALAKKLLGALGQRYATSVEDIDRQQATAAHLYFQKWFEQHWKGFQQHFSNYWNDVVAPAEDPDAPQQPHPNFAKLYSAYTVGIDELHKSKFLTEEVIDDTHRRVRRHYPAPGAANYEVRKILVDTYVMPGLEELAEKMADSILDVIDEIANWIVDAEFFGLESVRDHIFPSNVETYRNQLVHGLRTLFLRYARPAIDIFLRTPRGTPDRANMLEVQQREIHMLKLYYDGEDERRRNLKQFLQTGKWESDILEHLERQRTAQVLETVVEVAAPEAVAVAKAGSGLLGALEEMGKARGTSMADSVADVKVEITEDSEAFVDYLKHAIFHAASLTEYCMQELVRIRDYLRTSDSARHGIMEDVLDAYHRKDPRLRSVLSEEMGDVEHIRRVVSRLAEVRQALAAMN